jgi:hypothetical protein
MAIRYSENFAARHSGEQTTADVPKSTRWHYAHGLGPVEQGEFAW